jgi:acyl-coenzyme A thioesterase PaaI-like protein
LRLLLQLCSLRPGGTIAGPHMMVLSQIGEVKLAVTTNLNINFLRKPVNSDLTAKGRMIKRGKRLAGIEVSNFNSTDIVAHATGT